MAIYNSGNLTTPWSFEGNVKNVLLHGHLKENVLYGMPPYYSLGDSNTVCRLNRSFYDLKQAPRVWFEKFHSAICSIGFQQSYNDHSLFTHCSSNDIVILLLYMDDMVITCSDQ